jgi:hypothetical protein
VAVDVEDCVVVERDLVTVRRPTVAVVWSETGGSGAVSEEEATVRVAV